MITIHTIAYNESKMIEFFIHHYRKNFPNCNIVIHDNYSTDTTVEIAKKYGCIIDYYDTNNTINDLIYQEVKNNCWKKSDTDWVLVCDVDELLDINESQLKEEESLGTHIISSKGYNMVSMIDCESNEDLQNITHGIRDINYDKYLLFNKSQIKEINYSPGCHNWEASDKPTLYDGSLLKFSSKKYKLLHYKCINCEYTINRYKEFSDRLSEVNRQTGMGDHYLTKAESITESYRNARRSAIPVLRVNYDDLVPKNFNVENYLNYNPDLKKYFIKPKYDDEDIKIHFVYAGLKENRPYSFIDQLPKDFDWRTYWRINPDLVYNNINSEMEVKCHYIKHGRFENREYLENIP
jgi:hypothetical protein